MSHKHVHKYNLNTMEQKHKIIELTLTENGEWIDSISLVEDPAIEVDFMTFGKEHFEFKTDDEKHIITGAVMVPDKKMWRNNFGGCWVYFSEDTCRNAAYRWLMENKNHSFSIHHQNELKDVSVIESWVKEDEADKSTALGFTNIPRGTWFISAKVDDEDLWQAIKNGEVNGFSIEGVFKLEEPEDEEKQIIKEAEDFLKQF